MDGRESIDAIGRTDDGSYETILSSSFAERAVVNGIGKFTKTDTVKLQVALKNDDDAKQFTFSKTWTPPD